MLLWTPASTKQLPDPVHDAAQSSRQRNSQCAGPVHVRSQSAVQSAKQGSSTHVQPIPWQVQSPKQNSGPQESAGDSRTATAKAFTHRENVFATSACRTTPNDVWVGALDANALQDRERNGKSTSCALSVLWSLLEIRHARHPLIQSVGAVLYFVFVREDRSEATFCATIRNGSDEAG